jgi:hypothetical protein
MRKVKVEKIFGPLYLRLADFQKLPPNCLVHPFLILIPVSDPPPHHGCVFNRLDELPLPVPLQPPDVSPDRIGKRPSSPRLVWLLSKP